MEVNSHQTELMNYTIHYTKIGTGPKVIFGFPGLMGSYQVGYKNLLERFNKHGDEFTFYSWDQPGYFKSQPPARKKEDISFEKEIEICAKFLKNLGHEKYYLMGWSAGAQMALLFTKTFPEMVEKVIVWGAFDMMDEDDLKAHQWFRNLENTNTIFLQEMIQENKQGYEIYESNWHAWMDLITSSYSAAQNDQIAWIEGLEAITAPVLIIYGGRDAVITRKCSDFLTKHIERAKLEIIPKGPHWIQDIFPDELFKLTQAFINEA